MAEIVPMLHSLPMAHSISLLWFHWTTYLQFPEHVTFWLLWTFANTILLPIDQWIFPPYPIPTDPLDSNLVNCLGSSSETHL